MDPTLLCGRSALIRATYGTMPLLTFPTTSNNFMFALLPPVVTDSLGTSHWMISCSLDQHHPLVSFRSVFCSSNLFHRTLKNAKETPAVEQAPIPKLHPEVLHWDQVGALSTEVPSCPPALPPSHPPTPALARISHKPMVVCFTLCAVCCSSLLSCVSMRRKLMHGRLRKMGSIASFSYGLSIMVFEKKALEYLHC